MAFAQKLHAEFLDDSGTFTWVVKLYQDGYVGASTEVICDDTPALLNWEGKRNTYQPIRASKLTWNVAVQSQVVQDIIEAIYGAGEMEYQLRLYKDDAEYWRGYVLTDQYSEPDKYFPFILPIYATCGLNMLKTIPFLDASEAQYEGVVPKTTVIANILGKIGYGLKIKTADAWYAEGMLTGDDNDPLEQAEIEQKNFYNFEDVWAAHGLLKPGTQFVRSHQWEREQQQAAQLAVLGEPLSCYQVLDSLLCQKGLRIEQTFDAEDLLENCWLIVQRSEYAEDTIRMRRYNAAGAYVEPSAPDYRKTVDGSTIRLRAGGHKDLVKAYRSAKLSFNHRLGVPNLIPNGDLATFELDPWTFDDQGIPGVSVELVPVRNKIRINGEHSSYDSPGDFAFISNIGATISVGVGESVKVRLKITARALRAAGVPAALLPSPKIYWKFQVGTKWLVRDTPDSSSWSDTEYWNQEEIGIVETLLEILSPDIPTGTNICTFTATQLEQAYFFDHNGTRWEFPNAYDGIEYCPITGTMINAGGGDEQTALTFTAETDGETPLPMFDVGTVLQGDGPTSQHYSHIIFNGSPTSIWARYGRSEEFSLNQLAVTAILQSLLTPNKLLKATIRGQLTSHNSIIWRSVRHVPNDITFNPKLNEWSGEWQEVREDEGSVTVGDEVFSSTSVISVGSDVGQVIVKLANATRDSQLSKAITVVRTEVAAGVGITSLPIEPIGEALLQTGDEVVVINLTGSMITTLTLAGDQGSSDNTLTVDPFTITEDLLQGSGVYRTEGEYLSMIVQNRDAILLRVQYGEVLSQFTVEAESITAETNIMKSNNWNGTLVDDTITVSGSAGWALSGAGQIDAVSGWVGGWALTASAFTADSGAAFINAATPAIGLGAATDFMTGVGFWVGKNVGAYKLHIGNPAGQYLSWDGSEMEINGVVVTGSDVSGTTADQLTINLDGNDEDIQLVLNRTTGGAAVLEWDGTTVSIDKPLAVTGTLTVTGNFSLLGSAANIILGSNYLSGDGGDEGISIDASGNVTVSGTLTSSAITASGEVTATGSNSFTITGAAATARYSSWQTAGVNRWLIGADASAETGSNVGSDWVIRGRSDAGADLGTYLTITRSTGATSLSGTLSSGAITAAGVTTAPQFVSNYTADFGVAAYQLNYGNRIRFDSGANYWRMSQNSAGGFNIAKDGVADAVVIDALGSVAILEQLKFDTDANFWRISQTVAGGLNITKDAVIDALVFDALGAAAMGGSLTVAGEVTVTGSNSFTITGAAATARYSSWQTAGVNRWLIGADASAETGSNVGSDWVIRGRSDAGADLGSYLTITRSTGATSLSGTLSSGAITASGDITIEKANPALFFNADANNYTYQDFSNGATDGNFRVGAEGSTGAQLAVGSSPFAGIINRQGLYPLQFATNNTVYMTLSSTGSLTVAGDAAINGGDLTSTATTFNLFNATVTTLNFAGAGVAINIGASAGFSLLPNAGYSGNLGSLAKKYLTLHAAELWVETLVAQNTIATIGGRILGGPTTQLIADLTDIATTIDVKHNEMASGDRVYMEANAKVEFMSIDSAATPITGGYRYTVTRNLDGSGANAWNAGDAIFNTGTTGDGFIDIYSVAGVKAGTEYGPAIVGNIRNSATYNDWDAAWAIGNLNGVYGYIADTYGAAFGKYNASNNHITIDPTNGVRFFSGTATVLGQLTSTTWTLGNTTTEHISISSTAVQIKDGATVCANLTAGALSLGDTANEHTLINTSGIALKDGANVYALFAATTTIGLTASEHISISSTSVQIIDSASVYTDLTAGVLTLGLQAGGEDAVIDGTDGIRLYGGGSLKVQLTNAGVLTLGDTANEHVNLTATALQFKDGATVLTDVSGGNVTIGEVGASKANLYISAGTAYFRINTTAMLAMGAAVWDGLNGISMGNGVAFIQNTNIQHGHLAFVSLTSGTFTDGDAVLGEIMVATGVTNPNNVAGRFTATVQSGATVTSNYAVRALATAISGTTNYGIFATALAGTTNWAGYFDDGNVYIKNNLGIGTPTLSGKLNIMDHTTAAGGLYIGSDVTLYRSAANTLTTDDDFVAATLKTSDPGAGAGKWKLGQAEAGSGLTLRDNLYVAVEIDGVDYNLALVTAGV